MFKNRWEKMLSKVFFDDGLAAEMDAMMNPEPGDNNINAGGGGETDELDTDEEETEDSGAGEQDSEDTEEDSEEDEKSADSEDDDSTSGDDSDSGDSSDGDDSGTELEALKAQNVELMKIVSNISTPQEKIEETKEEKVIDLYDSDEFKNLKEAFDWDKDEVSAFKLFQAKANEQTMAKAMEQLQQMAPSLVTKTMKTQNDLNKIKTDFYDDNPALATIKPYVAQIASQVAKEKGSNVSIADVLNEAAEKVYKVMGIDKDKFAKDNDGNKTEKGKKPAFPKSKGSRKTAPKKTKLANEIDSMLAIDE